MGEPDWERLLAEKDARIAEQDARIAELEALVEQLLAKLGMNSLNSSKAPSSDDAEAKAKRRERAAKHARRRKKDARRKNRSKRTLLPPEMVTSCETHVPEECDHCGHRLRERDLLDEPERIQKVDLPELRPLVHELRLCSAVCPRCDEVTAAPRPASARTSKVGPNLRALMVLMLGRFHLSRRDVIAFLFEVLGVEVSLGLLSKIEAQVTEKLEAPYQEAVAATQQAPVVHADETGWSHGGIPGWLWIASTGHVARFRIDDRRNKQAAAKLLGPGNGVTVSDRWVAYQGRRRRQLCWAHLERNAQALVERGGAVARVGLRFIEFVKEMFHLWHRFLDDDLERLGLRRQIKERWTALLRDLSGMPMPPRAQTFVDGVMKVEAHLFTFTRVDGVEPTNNLAERDLRAAVMWRRKSQATRSARGRRFVERILTVVTSLRAQGRNIFDFLRDTLRADRPTPSLLPASSV